MSRWLRPGWALDDTAEQPRLGPMPSQGELGLADFSEDQLADPFFGYTIIPSSDFWCFCTSIDIGTVGTYRLSSLKITEPLPLFA